MVLVYSLFVVVPVVCCIHVLWSVFASFRFDNRLADVEIVGCLAFDVAVCVSPLRCHGMIYYPCLYDISLMRGERI